MNKYNHIEKETEKKYKARDKKKRKRMKVTGKSVFTLQKLMKKSPVKKAAKIRKIRKKK